MPYIPKKERKLLSQEDIKTAGQLTYVYYKKMLELWRQTPKFATICKIEKMVQNDPKQLVEIKWWFFSDLKVAATRALKEFDRRIAGPYEDKKRKENGDVYE